MLFLCVFHYLCTMKTHDMPFKSHSTYYMDEASDFYSQLEKLINTDAHVRHRYIMLRDIMRRFVEQTLIDAPVQVSGLFAKIDYIVKAHGIMNDAAQRIHATRHNLNAMGRHKDEELDRTFLTDVRNTAEFVSLIYPKQQIPQSLAVHLPLVSNTLHSATFSERVIRCIVESWDESFITATEEQNNTHIRIDYSTANRYLYRIEDFDWSYLSDIIEVGTILNLVRPRMKDGVCQPELIIYEPDYLINVTTVAACFETFAETADLHIINKLRAQENSEYIHLGNLSGQFLDDTVHGSNRTYEECWVDFLKQNALGLITCEGISTQEKFGNFKTEAQRQKHNIEKLIGYDLHELPNIDDFKREDILLEPTFFSEVLGLQGRLDFLWETVNQDESQRKTIIIEQKSGKGENVWPPMPGADSEVPSPKEQHLVQLNLYRALFYYEFNKQRDALQHLMLLYSKYEKGLVSIGTNLPQLLLRSIKVRNELAHREYKYAREGVDVLTTIKAEDFRRKRVSDKLWEPYVKPRLDEIIQPLHDASELERRYFLRFMKFIEKEQMLSKIGNKTKESSGFASLWNDTLEDKKASGTIYDELSVQDFIYTDDGKSVKALRLRFATQQSIDSSNFRRGDIVVLYSYRRGEIPVACRYMVIRGSIVDITCQSIIVNLRNSQSDERIFVKDESAMWAIEHDMFESSTNGLYSGLHSFLKANKSRRELIMLQREPKVDTTLSLKGKYGAFNTLVTRAKQARELFLVIGPPGTGKTSYGMLYQLREELMEDTTNVIIMSYTNRAVDEICSKLKEDGIDFIRIGSELSAEEIYRNNLLCNRVLECKSGAEVARMVKSCRVFCGTTAALMSQTNLFRLKKFDLAIIDESSQILEPHIIGLLSAKHIDGDDAIKRFVMIGDHKQLPAVVQQQQNESVVEDELLNSINLHDCALSLFERLLTQFKKGDGTYDPRYVYMLTKQGRMHRDIAEFPNKAFYGGKLDVVPLNHQILPTEAEEGNWIRKMITAHRISFIASELPEFNTSIKTNPLEARLIADIVKEIYELAKKTKEGFVVDKTLGIIVPYRNQISTVRNEIDKWGIPVLHDITIDTVERYQGSQRDYIIYGFTIQQAYQLNFLTNNTFVEDGALIDRKLNVAMTRARLNLIMIGNPQLLEKNETFSNLIEFVKGKGGYVDKAPQGLF